MNDSNAKILAQLLAGYEFRRFGLQGFKGFGLQMFGDLVGSEIGC